MTKITNTNMQTFIAAFVSFTIFAVIIGVTVGSFFISGIGATSGQHTGFVTAVETNTFVFTKHRAYVKTDLASSQEDRYCVKDASVIERLQEASQNSEKVTFRFSHPFIEWLWNCGGEDAIIVGVK